VAKAAVNVTTTSIDQGTETLRVGYDASLSNGSSFSADVTLSFADAPADHVSAIKASVMGFASGQGVVLAYSDIALYGGPV
jgi:hypothetical protein